jgi:hypothetical protein
VRDTPYATKTAGVTYATVCTWVAPREGCRIRDSHRIAYLFAIDKTLVSASWWFIDGVRTVVFIGATQAGLPRKRPSLAIESSRT